MTPWSISIVISAFLLTYLLHSTVATMIAAVFASRLRRLLHPELRVLVWKLVLVLPIVSAGAATFSATPHFGLQWIIEQSTATAEPTESGVDRSPFELMAMEGNAASLVPSDRGADDVVLDDHLNNRQASGLSEVSTIATPAKPRLFLWKTLTALWLISFLIGVAAVLGEVFRLQRLRQQATPLASSTLHQSLAMLCAKMRLGRRVQLFRSPSISTPMTAGIRRPYILLPWNSEQLSPGELDAILAHELVHIARADATWNLLGLIIRRCFIFQPLVWFAERRLREEMDFVADSQAASMLGDRVGLIHCLVMYGDQMVRDTRRVPSLTAGMATFRSTLGQRVEVLLNLEHEMRRLSFAGRSVGWAVAMAGAGVLVLFLPRVISNLAITSPLTTVSSSETEAMKKQIASMALLAGMTAPANAQEQPSASSTAAAQIATLKTEADKLPAGTVGFNGMLVGRLAAKDIERGTFLVLVDAVSRVWENSKADNPQSLVGKTVEVTGVFGKFLDVLVVTRVGETIEFECKREGDQLKFPGEMLRKVAPYAPENYPTLPEEFRGFQGSAIAQVIQKDPESLEMIVQVQKVLETWDGNRAQSPASIQGKRMLLAGFWNRKDAFHSIKAGDRIEVGLKHVAERSNHLSVAEFIRTAGGKDAAEMTATDATMMKENASSNPSQSSSTIQGFRGMLVGRLVEKDIERGTFTITVDAVPRVWENNQATKPKSLIGQNVHAGGVAGKMLDALVVTRVGETLEFGAVQNSGDVIRVGEVLRKVAPVQPGDYPELPEAFRGFQGMIVGKVVKKDEHLMELIVEINDIQTVFEGSSAENPNAIVGKSIMLAGFWQRKDAFQKIKVGDVIECGVAHKQKLSDMLNVIESIKVIDN